MAVLPCAGKIKRGIVDFIDRDYDVELVTSSMYVTLEELQVDYV